jgi:hypothetical protein
VQSHYINGGYGATPGNSDGHPHRRGGVALINSFDRLDPSRRSEPNKNLAVYAAEMKVKKYCVCAGNYATYPGGRAANPADPDLLGYLDLLKATPNISDWPYFFDQWSPRRAFGPGANGGDIGGQLVWGAACDGWRHFDCVGFISFVIWEATGKAWAHDISQWRANPNPLGAKVFELPLSWPGSLEDGDIVVKADHHIAFAAADGTLIQAEDTQFGVTTRGKFKKEDWTHLVRLTDASFR